jgi:carbonic anhydrase
MASHGEDVNQGFLDLLKGNIGHAAAYHGRFDDLQEAQHPHAVTVCCSDSRVLQDAMWGNDAPGDVFTVSNIGNRVGQRTDAGEVVSGDVLYPVAHTGTETVVVVGHSGCGAVTATYDALTDDLSEPPGIEHCIDLLSDHLQAGVDLLPEGLDRAEAVNRLVEYNVDQQVEFLLASDEIPESVDVVGVVYDFQDVYPGGRGEVHVVNVGGDRFAESIRETHPDLADRVSRLWEY